MNNEQEKQRYGRCKDTCIDHTYISGGEFRKKFDQISDSPELNKLLYNLAKKMLFHRSGTNYEDMYWIDAESVEVVAQVTDSIEESRVIYPHNIVNFLKMHSGLVTIHSHPAGLPPSIEDFNSNYIYGYNLGIVIGHNGKLYLYNSNEEIDKLYFELKVESYRSLGYNESESREKAIKFCMEKFDINYKEVTIDE